MGDLWCGLCRHRDGPGRRHVLLVHQAPCQACGAARARSASLLPLVQGLLSPGHLFCMHPCWCQNTAWLSGVQLSLHECLIAMLSQRAPARWRPRRRRYSGRARSGSARSSSRRAARRRRLGAASARATSRSAVSRCTSGQAMARHHHLACAHTRSSNDFVWQCFASCKPSAQEQVCRT